MRVATRVFLYLICATLLFSCISNSPVKFISRQLEVDGISYTNKIVLGPQFTKEQTQIALIGLSYVSTITDMDFNVDFTYYYWATNLPSDLAAITINMDKSKHFRTVLVSPSVYPVNTNNYIPIVLFGTTVAHEWLHLHHDLHHPQVQQICDDKVVEHINKVVDAFVKSQKSP